MACNHAVWPLEFRRKEVCHQREDENHEWFPYRLQVGPWTPPVSSCGFWPLVGYTHLACRKSWACFIQPLGVYWTIAILSIQVLGQTEDCDYYAAAISVPSLLRSLPFSVPSSQFLFAVSGVHGTATLFGSAVPFSPTCPSLPAPWTLDSMPRPLYMRLFPVELG